MSELESGGFRPVIDDASVTDKSKIKRLSICSGKVYYDLDAARSAAGNTDVAIIRLEQFYPFPTSMLTEVIAAYKNANEIVWTQEEPRNMGGWTFVEPRLRNILPDGVTLQYVGRAASASPATGSYAIHNLEQAKLVDETLGAPVGESSAAV